MMTIAGLILFIVLTGCMMLYIANLMWRSQ
jgi:hypothetical protein